MLDLLTPIGVALPLDVYEVDEVAIGSLCAA
jgi:hypothetical protein